MPATDPRWPGANGGAAPPSRRAWCEWHLIRKSRAEPPIHNAGGRTNIFGGFFLINGPHDAVHAQEIFAFNVAYASVHLFSVKGWNWRTTTGKLTNGPGKIHLHQGSEITTAPPDIGNP